MTADLAEQIWAALGTVHDPELDEPLTKLGFVSTVDQTADQVTVHLRLPTSFCAPNFAYLMVADAHDAVTAVAAGRVVSVVLDDHFAGEEINSGVAARHGFGSTFARNEPGEDDPELEALRRVFLAKAQLAAQDRVVAVLAKSGHDRDSIAAMNLADLPDCPEVARMLARRAELGWSVDAEEPLLVGQDGRAVHADEVAFHLRFAATVRRSIEGNGAVCRALLAARYGPNPVRTGSVPQAAAQATLER